MYSSHSHQREDTPDPLTELLAQLLADIPHVLPTPITTHASPSPSANHVSIPSLTCQWITPRPGESPLICGIPLPLDPKLACDHLRYAHDVRGNEKVHVDCHWRDCRVAPMLRGSLVRHVLTVHLGLLRWRCEMCGKVFSRKGTGHACVDGA